MISQARAPDIDATEWPVSYDENLGSKPHKRWLVDPDGRSWLFKPVTLQRLPEETFPKGEDWAEKIAGSVAGLLRIPAAHVELAHVEAEHGVISRDVRDGADVELVLGNEVLAGVDPDYPKHDRHAVSGYTVDRIFDALTTLQVLPPPGTTGNLEATGVFAGYLVLDALVANTDRHHENWALLRARDQTTPDHLAATFDHASSLGFQLSASQHRALVDQADVAAWAARGTSRHVVGRPTLVALAVEACRATGKTVDWRNRVEAVEADALDAAVEQIPPARMNHRTPVHLSARC